MSSQDLNSSLYEYYSGANVVIEVEGVPILEACGIRHKVMESKRPVYGYSSRHFDAVATGQVLVEGAILINYVDQNYLFRTIEQGLRYNSLLKTDTPPPAVDLATDLRDQLANEGNADSLLNQFQLDPLNNTAIPTVMKSLWRPGVNTVSQATQYVPNPHDSFAGLNIRITYGDREAYNFYSGNTSELIEDVHFVGRGKQIQIDENVIIEEHAFFARNIRGRILPYVMNVDPSGDEVTIGRLGE